MYKYAIVFCLVFATACATEAIEPSEIGEAANRFLATTSTSTAYVVTTTISVSTVTRTCASTSNVTGSCRRRRGIEEKPLLIALDEDINVDELLPAKPSLIEPSTHAELPQDVVKSVEAVPNNGELESSVPVPEGQAKGFFYLTLVSTTTSTITSTSLVTVTAASSKTYTVVGCTPSGFSTSLC